MQPQDLPEYRFPNLKPAIRQYVVRDDLGHYGIAYADPCYHKDVLFAHPINTQSKISSAGVRGAEALPSNATLLTDTVFKLRDGVYQGTWYDYNGIGQTPQKDIRTLTIVDDLGWLLPDHWADVALAGSDQMGHWDYGATLGKVGGEPPVKGQKSGEMTVEQAQDYAKEVGEQVTTRGIRLAAKNGYIPNARKLGRDWLITYEGFNHYLDNRPLRGPKRQPTQRGADGE